jgi:predicted amino acid racemase
VAGLGDSRIENIEAIRHVQTAASLTLIRTPMLSQAERVVMYADASLNSELDVIQRLSLAAQRAQRMHGIVLMVEMGDLREGIMPDDVLFTVRKMLCLPNIAFRGIGTNLACRSGVSPDAKNMAKLSALADAIEAEFGLSIDIVSGGNSIVSGGNSANLNWVFNGANTGRINELRLGESILLGCEPLHRQPIEGLYTDAITLVAEVIESKIKPSRPTGEIAQTAFGKQPVTEDRGHVAQTILAIGEQDTDPHGLIPPPGCKVLGASSDHLVLESNLPMNIGAELAFQLNYSALLRAMTSPFVYKALNPLKRTSNNS